MGDKRREIDRVTAMLSEQHATPMTDEAGILQLIQDLLVAGEIENLRSAVLASTEKGEINWDYFLRVVAAQRIGPLLYDITKGQNILPVFVERELEISYIANARRNLVLLHELQRALSHLDAGGISAIVLKGAALAETVYRDNFALRPMGDVDILVPAAAAERSRQLLTEIGYEYEVEARPGANITFENEVALVKESSEPFYLEMHWSLFNSPFYQQFPADWYWESAVQTRTSSGVVINTLSPEAQILYYAGHMVLHHGSELHLLWFYDMIRVIQEYGDDMDWQLILDRAQESYLILPVRQTLNSLSSDWRAPIPGWVLARLEEMTPTAEETAVFAALTASKRPVAQRFLWDLRTMPGWRQRLHYAWINLFPAPAYMYQRHGFSSPLHLPFLYAYRLYLGLRSSFAYLLRRL